MASDPRLVQFTDCECNELSIPQWQVNAGEGWCVFGRNGSGKQLIDQLLVGDILPRRGEIERFLEPAQIALGSFERQQATYEEEWRLAATDIIPEDEWGTRVAEFQPPPGSMTRSSTR